MKVISLLVLLLCMPALPREKETVLETNQPDVIFPLLKEYVYEGKRNGVYIDWFLSQNLYRIQFLPEEQMVLHDSDPSNGTILGKTFYNKTPTGIGRYYAYRPEIILHEDLLQDEQMLRHVLWHELGHVFSLPHNSEDEAKDRFRVMNEFCPPMYEFKEKPHSPEEWRKYSEIYWSKVKNSDRKKWLFVWRNDNE